MAFGDMPNDAEMLCWAGEGLPWPRGSQRSLGRWGAPARPFHEDGVAQTIEAMLAERSLGHLGLTTQY